VFVIGACGVGKTSALARMRPVLGPRVGEVAVIETDTVYMMIDPAWEIEDKAAYLAYTGVLTARIVSEFVHAGYDWIAVGSNGLQDRASVDAFVELLPSGVSVHHLMLDPEIPVVQGRIARRAHPFDRAKSPEWIARNVEWMRGHLGDWNARLDNSDLTVDETVEAIYAAVRRGEGKLL
jgi:hypothetical protein